MQGGKGSVSHGDDRPRERLGSGLGTREERQAGAGLEVLGSCQGEFGQAGRDPQGLTCTTIRTRCTQLPVAEEASDRKRRGGVLL